MKVITKGNSSPNGKRRVYFTCHPADHERSFEKIKDDIFKTHDVAIYYNDIADPDDAPASDPDLEQMNLFVIPVSFKLLSEPNNARDNDLKYALTEHIPVLPVMLETGLDTMYENCFGTLEYLSPYVHDETAISYEEKLKKYLESVLVGDELAQQVSEAFDAYIFLSYRKKDRQYANTLMRLIHSNPICRDIAIWYDEFLVPGEAFDQAIEEAMSKSKLFTLLVTPHLIERDENNEKIENYVETIEYPRALEAKKPILPMEMEETDREQLEARYQDIPACVIPNENDEFYDQFIQAITKEAKTENDKDPKHNFLIGLAYLEGIDVEVNRERAVELITGAADAGLPEAMEKLAYMYRDGYGVDMYRPAYLEWYEKFVDAYAKQPDSNEEMLLVYRCELANIFGEFGRHHEAIDTFEYAFEYFKGRLGEEHLATLTILNNLAYEYGQIGNDKKSLELQEQAYEVRLHVLGEDHPDTLCSLNNLALEYGAIGNHEKSIELYEQVYEACKRVLGEDNPNTLKSLINLASEYGKSGNHEKALGLKEQAYEVSKSVLGEDHPDTLCSLNNLAYTYGTIDNHETAIELFEKAYEASKRVLGEDHPGTRASLNQLSFEYYYIGNHEKALELFEEVYETSKRVLGENHPDTLMSLQMLAIEYLYNGIYEKANELLEQAYKTAVRVYGEEHPYTQEIKVIKEVLDTLDDY